MRFKDARYTHCCICRRTARHWLPAISTGRSNCSICARTNGLISAGTTVT